MALSVCIKFHVNRLFSWTNFPLWIGMTENIIKLSNQETTYGEANAFNIAPTNQFLTGAGEGLPSGGPFLFLCRKKRNRG